MSDFSTLTALMGLIAASSMSNNQSNENAINSADNKIEGFYGKPQSEIGQVEESEIEQPDKTVKLTAEQKEYLIEKIKKCLTIIKGITTKCAKCPIN